MTSKRISFSLLTAFVVGCVLTFAFPPPKEANAQVFGPTTRTPSLIVSPGTTSVQNLTINGTCTGCASAPIGANTELLWNNNGVVTTTAGLTWNSAVSNLAGPYAAFDSLAAEFSFNIEAADVAPGNGTVNNWNPRNGLNDGVVYRMSSGGGATITGLQGNGSAGGKLRVLINVGSTTINFNHQDALSSAANRIISPTAANIALGADDSIMMWYDTTTLRWRVIDIQN